MADIHPAQRAQFDRELSTAVELLLAKAAEHDGKDIVEANVDLTNWLLARLDCASLAEAAAMLALRLHRQGGIAPDLTEVPDDALSQRIHALIFNGVTRASSSTADERDWIRLTERERIARAVYDELRRGDIEFRLGGMALLAEAIDGDTDG